MAIRPQHLLFLLLLPAATLARADVCDVPMELPAKPELSDYADYGAFVVDIMNYKKKQEEVYQHRQDCPDIYQQAPIEMTESTENLESAVAEARESIRAGERAMAGSSIGSLDNRTDMQEQSGDNLSGLFLDTSLDVLNLDLSAHTDPGQLTNFLSFSLADTLVDDPRSNVSDPQRQDELFPEGAEFLLESQVPILGPLQVVDIEFGERTSILLRADGTQLNRSATVMQNCLSSCAGN